MLAWSDGHEGESLHSCRMVGVGSLTSVLVDALLLPFGEVHGVYPEKVTSCSHRALRGENVVYLPRWLEATAVSSEFAPYLGHSQEFHRP